MLRQRIQCDANGHNTVPPVNPSIQSLNTISDNVAFDKCKLRRACAALY